ncbi:MAG: hypothetical protein ABIR71_13890 [Chthoniobacterales bacterium]
MTRLTFFTSALLTSLFLAGCVTTPGVVPPNQAVVQKFATVSRASMATVVIYRERNFSRSLIYFRSSRTRTEPSSRNTR